MKKEWLAGALSLALLSGLLPAGASGFPDVTNPATAEATQILRQLGVVSGLPDGTFAPGGTFTRAEFCKMALTILDRQAEAALQQGRVIFTDVTADHWALGYINAASTAPDKDSSALVQGKGDGTFAPDDAITCGEAVAILIRSLGYSDQEVAMSGAWYAGHMSKAKTIGLLDGLETLRGDQTLTRAQAAELFENMLFVKGNGASSIFLTAQLGGKISESQLVLSVKEKALSGGGYALKTDNGTFKTFRDDLSEALQGQRCKLVLDAEGTVLALQPDEDFTTRRVRVIAAESRYLLTAQQEQILIGGSTPVWRAGKEEGVYSDLYLKDIPYGATAVLCYDSTDTLTSLYLLDDSDSAITAVVDASGKLSGILPDANTQIYRNGLTASLSSLRPYDVVRYDAASGILTATDNKLTGVYENASPSPVSPTTITVMGCELKVLDSALASLSAFSLGDKITLLLDEDNAVAAVVSADKVSAQAIGVASIRSKTSDGKTTYTAKVALSSGLTVQGEVSSTLLSMESAPGRLVLVSSGEMGKLTLTRVSDLTPPGNWSVNKNKLGSLGVSPQVAVYEKAGNTALTQLEKKDVTLSTVPYSKITYYHTDASGVVDCIQLDNVTGACYTYGVVSDYQSGYDKPSDGSGFSDFKNAAVTLENSKGETELVCGSDYAKLKGKYLGISTSLKGVNGSAKAESYVLLQSIGSVRRSAFGEETVTVNGTTYPLDVNIDSSCYNAKSGVWFPSLDAALAYSSRLSVYCDKSPDQGGKIRMVVVE